MTAAGFHDNFIFRTFIDKTVFLVDASAVFAVFMLSFFGFTFARQSTVAGNAS